MALIEFKWIVNIEALGSSMADETMDEITSAISSKFGVHDYHDEISSTPSTPEYAERWFMFPNLEVAVSATDFMNTLHNTYTHSDIITDMNIEILNFERDTPLLKYLPYKVIVHGAPILDNIFDHWRQIKPLKAAIWGCQKEMIDVGFEGNAKY
jgi:hypothetical protein